MRVSYYLWRFVHNAIIHPLIGVFGERKCVMYLHDWTEQKWDTAERSKI